MEERYYGLNMSIIPKEVIPFIGESLHDRDTIENSYGDVLVWMSSWHGYALLTDDPTRFLSISRIYSHWKKR